MNEIMVSLDCLANRSAARSTTDAGERCQGRAIVKTSRHDQQKIRVACDDPFTAGFFAQNG